jgi:hypothetical protein
MKMNKGIIKTNNIINFEISEENYFQDILIRLYKNNLLNESDVENIQFQILESLTEKIQYYTKGESTSVRIEIAEKIMASIYYTIGIFLKKESSITNVVDLIKNKGMKFCLLKGESLVKEKIEETKVLLNLVKENKLYTENYGYNDTIDYGIPLFFKEYNSDFGSHETPGSIDYPLCNDKMEKVGIEYIQDYLKKIYLENEFCSFYENSEIEILLRDYDKNSHHLLINIFELVLRNTIASILTGKGTISLEITSSDIVYLQKRLENLSKIELSELLLESAIKCCDELNVENDELRKYIYEATNKLTIIKEILELNKLETIFITVKDFLNESIKFEDGERIEDSLFRYITEEIRECILVKDKIKIIRERINSLVDLVDILGADCIFDNEFEEIFAQLYDNEIALLIKYIPNIDYVDSYYETESEKQWHGKLNFYLDGIDSIRRKQIIELSNKINI